MPTCIIEYGKDLEKEIDIPDFIDALHKTLNNSGLFEENDIKTRAAPFVHYKIGTTEKSFIHINIHILSGRSSEQKRSLSQSVLQHLKTLNLINFSLTVEIREIDRDSYSKIVT
ncbi:MAG: 5-carboxymethyl-2-hydroxymuconate Delta-isomerase [Cellvibrionaceae bacterium]